MIFLYEGGECQITSRLTNQRRVFRSVGNAMFALSKHPTVRGMVYSWGRLGSLTASSIETNTWGRLYVGTITLDIRLFKHLEGRLAQVLRTESKSCRALQASSVTPCISEPAQGTIHQAQVVIT